MTFSFRTLALTTALGLSFVTTASADVTIRYLASQGGLNAHELAAELGYFDGTGITLENVGYATAAPPLWWRWLAAAWNSDRRPRRRC